MTCRKLHRTNISFFYFCNLRATNTCANIFDSAALPAPRHVGNPMTANFVDSCKFVRRRRLPLNLHLHQNRHHRLRREHLSQLARRPLKRKKTTDRIEASNSTWQKNACAFDENLTTFISFGRFYVTQKLTKHLVPKLLSIFFHHIPQLRHIETNTHNIQPNSGAFDSVLACAGTGMEML